MRDGLFKVSFQTERGVGAGVLVLDGGRLRGGDGATYFTGAYQIDGPRFTARVTVRRHSPGPGLRLLFGLETFTLDLAGDIVGDEALMRGTCEDAPEIRFSAVLHRLEA